MKDETRKAEAHNANSELQTTKLSKKTPKYIQSKAGENMFKRNITITIAITMGIVVMLARMKIVSTATRSCACVCVYDESRVFRVFERLLRTLPNEHVRNQIHSMVLYGILTTGSRVTSPRFIETCCDIPTINHRLKHICRCGFPRANKTTPHSHAHINTEIHRYTGAPNKWRIACSTVSHRHKRVVVISPVCGVRMCVFVPVNATEPASAVNVCVHWPKTQDNG